MSWNLIILGFNCQRDSRALGRRGLDKNTGRSEGRKFLEESALRTVNRINFCSAGGRRVARRGRLDVITRASLIQTYSGTEAGSRLPCPTLSLQHVAFEGKYCFNLRSEVGAIS